ncbi:MAG: thiamine pyrophosphate-dependent enzyme [Geminicoccaceae bacterium]
MSGLHRILLSQVWPACAPRTLLQSNGLCTMGCGLPLAIGAKLAEPERPVAVLTGDGGLLIGAGRARHRGRAGPARHRHLLRRPFAGADRGQAARAPARQRAVAVGAFDVVQLAAGLGGHGVVAGDRASLAAALERRR